MKIISAFPLYEQQLLRKYNHFSPSILMLEPEEIYKSSKYLPIFRKHQEVLTLRRLPGSGLFELLYSSKDWPMPKGTKGHLSGKQVEDVIKVIKVQMRVEYRPVIKEIKKALEAEMRKLEKRLYAIKGELSRLAFIHVYPPTILLLDHEDKWEKISNREKHRAELILQQQPPTSPVGMTCLALKFKPRQAPPHIEADDFKGKVLNGVQAQVLIQEAKTRIRDRWLQWLERSHIEVEKEISVMETKIEQMKKWLTD